MPDEGPQDPLEVDRPAAPLPLGDRLREAIEVRGLDRGPGRGRRRRGRRRARRRVVGHPAARAADRGRAARSRPPRSRRPARAAVVGRARVDRARRCWSSTPPARSSARACTGCPPAHGWPTSSTRPAASRPTPTPTGSTSPRRWPTASGSTCSGGASRGAERPGGPRRRRDHPDGRRRRPGALVDLNTATAEQLDTLPGRRPGHRRGDHRLPHRARARSRRSTSCSRCAASATPSWPSSAIG